MNSYQFQDAFVDDLPQINALMRLSKAHWGYDENFMNTFMEKFGMDAGYIKKNTVKLLSIHGKTTGFYGFSVHPDGSLELDHFFLHPEYIGKGMGRMLWNASCNTARELGATHFVLWCDPNAESFYLRMGCEKIGEKKSPMMSDRYPAVMRYFLG
jgi:streptomycin 6-kinase